MTSTTVKKLGQKDNEDGRWRSYLLEEILARDKASLDVLWLKDDSVIDLENIPEPDVIADEIVTNLEEALSLMKRDSSIS